MTDIANSCLNSTFLVGFQEKLSTLVKQHSQTEKSPHKLPALQTQGAGY